MRLRVGVVGLGESWENRHRPALRALGDRFEVRAVCSAVSLLAEQAAQDFHCCSVDGFQALASRSDIDAVLMLAPDWYGPLPILAACERGKAVYCASALDMHAEQALAVKQRVEASGVAFMAELPRRQSPATLRLKELMATRLGRPQVLFCHERATRRGPGSCDRGRICSAATRSLMEQADWCQYVIGSEPSSVFAVSHSDGEGGHDYQMLSLEFPGEQGRPSALAHISYGSYLRPSWSEAWSFRPPAALQVCCERGVAFVDLPATLVWFDDAGRHQESLEHDRPVGEQLLTLFHRSVTSLVRRTSGLEDAYRALCIMAAAAESSRQGRRVRL